MGSRDQFDDITEPLKVDGITLDESNVDDPLNDKEKNENNTRETRHKDKDYEKGKTEASIHLVVDNEPLQIPAKNLVKDSYKFIHICDSSDQEGRPTVNGHIPSKKPNHTHQKKDDFPIQEMVLIEKDDPKDSKQWKPSRSQSWWCMFFLLLANLINYMDRVTIAGKC